MDANEARRRLVAHLERQGVLHDPRVAEAIATVPREAFVAVDPFADAPQPIGAGQTISAPHIVAMMSETLDVQPGHRVLDVGGGSGYHAAILARLAAPGRVTSIERVPELAARAKAAHEKLGITNVETIVADGSLGYPPAAPYDRICVAAAAPEIPRSLLAQLAPDGVLAIPVGRRDVQTLLRVRADGSHQPITAVCFVPLIGAEGWPS